MNEPGLSDTLLRVARALKDAAIPYAFGGAIALNYYVEPRATTDLDINIFLEETRSRPVLLALQTAGVPIDIDREEHSIRRDGQTRITWGRTAIDLFFQNFEFLEECAKRVWSVQYEGEPIRILSPEDLAICKVCFDRPKDWIDLRMMFHAQRGKLDLGYMGAWLHTILGEDDARITRYEVLLRSVHVSPERRDQGRS